MYLQVCVIFWEEGGIMIMVPPRSYSQTLKEIGLFMPILAILPAQNSLPLLVCILYVFPFSSFGLPLILGQIRRDYSS